VKNQLATLADLDRFDCIIDVRTPLEFAEDHIPGAINAPVLTNEERVLVGTMYKQVSPFEATRLGAALVAKNIAHYLQTIFADKPQNWRPLIYCWRGGKRSGSMTAWFNMIGWRARQLEGGYKAYRHLVLKELDALPGCLDFRVLCGLTGSGKTRLLHALAACGAQVLDLEDLAKHRGSLLGALPGVVQPSQKGFDSMLWQTLKLFDPARPVFTEAESKRIGVLQLPEALMQSLAKANCLRVEASLEDRVSFLCEDYAALFADAAAFKGQLARLTELRGRQTIERWCKLIDVGAKAELFRELILQHYDPAYTRSGHHLYPNLVRAHPFVFHPNAENLEEQALGLIAALAI